jgi:hypothetical protein
VNRVGAILIPLLVGFLATVAIVSWRTGWWWRRDALQSPAVAAPSVEVRRSNLRIVQVHFSAPPPATVNAAPAARPPATPEVQPEPDSTPLEPPAVPRVDPGNSPELLEAPARKFARGSSPGGD